MKCDSVDRQQTLRDILELVTQAENQFDIHLLVCVSHHHGLTSYSSRQNCAGENQNNKNDTDKLISVTHLISDKETTILILNSEDFLFSELFFYVKLTDQFCNSSTKKKRMH